MATDQATPLHRKLQTEPARDRSWGALLFRIRRREPLSLGVGAYNWRSCSGELQILASALGWFGQNDAAAE